MTIGCCDLFGKIASLGLCLQLKSSEGEKQDNDQYFPDLSQDLN